jgi:hypothetical protein
MHQRSLILVQHSSEWRASPFVKSFFSSLAGTMGCFFSWSPSEKWMRKPKILAATSMSTTFLRWRGSGLLEADQPNIKLLDSGCCRMALMRESPSVRGAVDACSPRKTSKRTVWTPAFRSFGNCEAKLPLQQLHCGASVGQGGRPTSDVGR